MDLLPFVLQGQKVYQITFPSGESIPFKLLNWQQFLAYRDAIQKGIIPQDILEASIFRECVLDQNTLDEVSEMRAGVVATIAGLVMTSSGPSEEPASFNQQLDSMRAHVDTVDSQIVMIICRAFPSYTPEEIMQLPWTTIALRLAQAERILMLRKPPELEEPMKLLTIEEIEAINKKQKKNKRIDPADLVRDGQTMVETVGISRDDEDERRTMMRQERLKKVREMERNRGR